MTRLDDLSQRYHTHPDEGGDYLSLDELNELCSLQHDALKRFMAMVEGDIPLPDPDHIIASRMEIECNAAEIRRWKEAHTALDRLFQSRLVHFSEAESEVDLLKLIIASRELCQRCRDYLAFRVKDAATAEASKTLKGQ